MSAASLRRSLFQSTLPRGERRPPAPPGSTPSRNFNPRSREGSDGDRDPESALAVLISIHAPARGATGLVVSDGCHVPISIHAPARGATYEDTDNVPQADYISIHAPARGATWEPLLDQLIQTISIHAPARGATPSDRARRRSCRYFNPRSREGSDQRPSAHADSLQNISIHAPARGATDFWKASSCFSLVFQSTLPRGERRFSTFTHFSPRPYFNPRSREGSDEKGFADNLLEDEISIHAPARGATPSRWWCLDRTLYFSPRSREGSDGVLPPQAQRIAISIHAPARGATSTGCRGKYGGTYFNPRSREGSDPRRCRP